MSVESDVYDAITGDSPLMALATGGVWPWPLPDNASFPSIVYMLVSDVPMASAKSGSFNSYRVQVSLCATGNSSYEATRQMRDALQNIIDGKSNWQKIIIGPDAYDDTGKFRYLPVDILIIQGD